MQWGVQYGLASFYGEISTVRIGRSNYSPCATKSCGANIRAEIVFRVAFWHRLDDDAIGYFRLARTILRHGSAISGKIDYLAGLPKNLLKTKLGLCFSSKIVE